MEDDFEFQLKQEALEKNRLNGNNNEETGSTPGTGGGTSSSGTYVDSNDGTTYEWDHQKRAWFPKIDENFIATYQATYGSHELDLSRIAEAQAGPPQPAEKKMTAEEKKDMMKQKKKEKRKLAAERQKNAAWFDIDEQHNTNVYVSGLPLNFTEAEFEELMSKCGIIARDLDKKLKMKLYRDADGNLKGDARCCYIKKESVDLALEILDGSLVGKNGSSQIHVERAKFEQKGDFDPSKKRKVNPKMKKRLKEQQERLFSWIPEKMKGERPKSDSTVVIKNAFTVKELTEDPVALFDVQNEMKAECSKYGSVRKLVVCDNNPEGVVLVTFSQPDEADDCITMMNFRVFRGKQLRAAVWDGKTKYKVEENKDDKEERLSSWQQFLEDGGNKEAVPVDPGKTAETGNSSTAAESEKQSASTEKPSGSSRDFDVDNNE